MNPLCLAWAVLSLLGLASASKNISVQIPGHPVRGRQVIHANYQSLSIEFFSFMEYSGNETYSNPMNINLLNQIRDLGGAPIKVRIGGSSQGSVWWIPDQEQGLIGYYEDGIDKTYNVTLGPAFFNAFDAWPEDTEFVLGLPYPKDEEGLLEANIQIAAGAYEKLGPRLVGLELGNERQESGSVPGFTEYFVDYADQINEAVFGDTSKKIYTAGTFLAPTLIECEDPDDETTCWSVESLLENGINENGVIKYADTHQYMLLFDTPTVNRQYLMNHNNTAFFVDSHHELAAHSTAQGIPYILGETNSLFGHGEAGISDTFAAALWTIDYTLYSAQTNITSLGFHQSFGWRYSAWRPIPAFGEPAGVLPSYYGFWLVQEALGADGGKGKQVEVVLAEDQVSAYAIYDSETGVLRSVVALNLWSWDEAGGEDSRSEISISLDLKRQGGCRASVLRLTAAGADVKDPEAVRLAGQYVDELGGSVHGSRKTEAPGPDGRLILKASEAALLTFDCGCLVLCRN